jgi:hypothetical protein
MEQQTFRWYLEIFGSLNSLNKMKHDGVIMIAFHPIPIIIIFTLFCFLISNNIASKLYEIKKVHFLMLLLKIYLYLGRTKWVQICPK